MAWGNQYHPSLNTGAYILSGGSNGGTDADRTWTAQHFDIIYGGTSDARIFDLMRSANPNLQNLFYIAYNTVMTADENWMRNWCTQNGKDVEGLYYHYKCDTVIGTRNTVSKDKTTHADCAAGSTNCESLQVYKKTLGMGGSSSLCTAGPTINKNIWFIDENGNESWAASGTKREGAQGGATGTSRTKTHVPSAWWYGRYPNVCPSCSTFVDAWEKMAESWITVAPGKTHDGIEGDTFNGTVEYGWDLHLELTEEMQAKGISSNESAHIQAEKDLVSSHNTIRQRLAAYTGKPGFIFGPNAGDVDYLYQQVGYGRMYHDQFMAPDYNDFLVEYLLTTTYAYTARILRFKQVYDSMVAGTKFTLNSQSNVGYGQYPKSYEHLVLATDYLLNHPNGYFAWHVGNAGNYDCIPNGSCQNSHWIKGYEYDIGKPVANNTTDCWGQTGTDRFFLYQGDGTRSTPATACEQTGGGVSYTVLARRYAKGLVLANFASTAGLSNFGTQKHTITLDGTYQQLQPDNTLGAAITSISLGIGEGAILVKSGSGGSPPPPPPPTNTAPGTPANNHRTDKR